MALSLVAQAARRLCRIRTQSVLLKTGFKHESPWGRQNTGEMHYSRNEHPARHQSARGFSFLLVDLVVSVQIFNPSPGAGFREVWEKFAMA